MLTAEHDLPIIRHALNKKLGAERGVIMLDPKIQVWDQCIRIEVTTILDEMDGLEVESIFELPLEFELAHLHNEIDEIAEHFKKARADWWKNGRALPPGTLARDLPGTGLRGLWPK